MFNHSQVNIIKFHKFSHSSNIYKYIFVVDYLTPGNPQAQKTNNNAAIISLLNSAPAAMTSSPVVSNLTNTAANSPASVSISSQVGSTIKCDSILGQQSQTIQPKMTNLTPQQTATLTQNILQGRKISLQTSQQQGGATRILGQTNLIAVNANSILNSAQLVGLQGQTLINQDLLQQQQTQQSQQQLSHQTPAL